MSYGNPPRKEQTRKEHVNMSFMIILQKGTNKNRNVFLNAKLSIAASSLDTTAKHFLHVFEGKKQTQRTEGAYCKQKLLQNSISL